MRIKGGRKSEFENGEPALLPAPAAWTSMSPVMPGRGDDTVWISHVTGIVWRRKLTIAGVTILGLLIGLAATVLMTPVYRAQASIQVEGFNDNVPSRRDTHFTLARQRDRGELRPEPAQPGARASGWRSA